MYHQRHLAVRASLFYRVQVPQGTSVEEFCDSLNALDSVEIAYPAPLPQPPPTSDYTYLQEYLNAATEGVDARPLGRAPTTVRTDDAGPQALLQLEQPIPKSYDGIGPTF